MISIIATETSVATIVIFPQAGKSSGFLIFWLCAGYITGRIIIARYYLKKLYKNHNLSIYSTATGNRPLAKKSLSLFYLIAKFISSGVRFFIGGVALYQLFGNIFFEQNPILGVIAWIIILSFFAGLYSLSGGLKAVIITDQLQGYIILVLGLTICLILVSTTPIPELKSTDLISLNSDIHNPLFSPVLFLAGLVLTIGSHGTDQDLLQRVLATNTLKEARKAIILSGIGATIIIMIYLAIGFFLRTIEMPESSGDYPLISYIKYLNIPLLTGSFAVLLFAAAMSTLDSAIHSTGAVWKDIIGGDQKAALFSLLSLIILVVFAISFTLIKNRDFLKLAMGSMNYVYGGLIAVISLYIFSNKTVATPVIFTAIISGFLVTLALNYFSIGLDLNSKKNLYTGWTWITLCSTFIAGICGWTMHYIWPGDVQNE